jgi:hypothetical protein
MGKLFGEMPCYCFEGSRDNQGLVFEIISPLSANGWQVGSVLRRTMNTSTSHRSFLKTELLASAAMSAMAAMAAPTVAYPVAFAAPTA